MAHRVYTHGPDREKTGINLSVVIAAYNEEEIIVPLTQAIIRTLDGLKYLSWELIYVIEGTDSTLSRIQGIARERPQIKLLYNTQPSGLGCAFRQGFDAVSSMADYVI